MGDYSNCKYDWFLLSGCVGTVSSLTSIGPILVSKAYKDFLYRLYLYISVSAIVESMCWTMMLATTASDGYIITVILSALINYSGSVFNLTSCWIGFDVFLMVMCGVTGLRRRALEIAGVTLLLVLPLPLMIMNTYFLVYKKVLPGTCIWTLVDSKVNLLDITSISTLTIGVYTFGVLFVSIATTSLCIRPLFSTQLNGEVRKFYRRALKGAFPFLILLICGLGYNITFFLGLRNFYASIITLLLPCIFVLLPVLLLCQPPVIKVFKCKKSFVGGEDDHFVTAPTNQLSTEVTSRTLFVIAPETTYTEQDQLINRQEQPTLQQP